jgi:hypothetical protein
MDPSQLGEPHAGELADLAGYPPARRNPHQRAALRQPKALRITS